MYASMDQKQQQYTGGIAAAGAMTDRAPEVPCAVERLAHTLGRIESLSESLDARLCAVARPSAPATEAKGLKGAMSTQMGSQLDSLNDAALRLESRLQGLYERLEV